jgi:hypothetical protein
MESEGLQKRCHSKGFCDVGIHGMTPGAPHWEHPLGPIPRGGLVVVARAHKCSRSNVSILFFLNLAVANPYKRFWCRSL